MAIQPRDIPTNEQTDSQRASEDNPSSQPPAQPPTHTPPAPTPTPQPTHPTQPPVSQPPATPPTPPTRGVQATEQQPNPDATGNVRPRLDRGGSGNLMAPNDPTRPPPENQVQQQVVPPGARPEYPDDRRQPVEVTPQRKQDGDPLRHPADTTATTKYNAPIDELVGRKDETEVWPPEGTGAAGGGPARTPPKPRLMTAESFDAGNTEDISKLPVVGDQADLGKVPDGALFQAKFLHDPGTDDMWAVKQAMPDLLSGRLVRRGMTADFWRNHASNRPPVGQRTGNTYRIVG